MFRAQRIVPIETHVSDDAGSQSTPYEPCMDLPGLVPQLVARPALCTCPLLIVSHLWCGLLKDTAPRLFPKSSGEWRVLQTAVVLVR